MTNKKIKFLITSLLLTTAISYNSAFAVDIVGDTIPTGTNLTITDNATVGGTLGVTGASTLSTLGVTGASTLTGALTANGGTTTTTLISTGNTTLGSGTASSLTFGSANSNSSISFNNNRLQNIADGVAATDAVNKRQLDKVETNLSRGVAGVAAMANLPAIDAGKKFNIGFGVAAYNGESAGSFGFQSRVNDMTVLKVSAASSFNGGDASVGAGVGISF